MIAPPDDVEVGYGRPPLHTRWKKGQSGDPRKRKPKRPETTVDLLDRLLTSNVAITFNGEPRTVTTLGAIVLSALQKAISGDMRALSTLAKYQEFAARNGDRKLELIFADNHYTQSFSVAADGDDYGK
jgi:uncharacterized protein DUF5681